MSQSTKVKAIIFTAIQTALGIEAIKTGENAVIAKAKFFKSIERKVTLVTIDNCRQAFISVAIAHYDLLHGLKGKLIAEYAKPVKDQIKESEKLKGCTLTFRQLKTNAAVMATRWIKYYKHFLSTGIVQKSTKRTGKRKAGGVVSTAGKVTAKVTAKTLAPPSQQADSVTLNTDPTTLYEAITLSVEELLGKKIVESIETPYQRDIVYSHGRYSNYAVMLKPSKSQLAIKMHYKAILDTASASCKAAKKTFEALEQAAKVSKFK